MQKISRFPQVDESARNDVGRTLDASRLPVHHSDDHEHAVFRQALAVAKHHFSHISDSQTIHHNIVCGNRFLVNRNAGMGNVQNLAVFNYRDVLMGNAGFQRKPCVIHEHGKLAVHGQQKLWFHERNEFFQFVLICVPGSMDIHHFVVIHVRSLAIQIVFYVLHGALVSRNDRGRENDRISFLNAQQRMFAVDDSHKHRPFFPLRSGC